jgi:hypothetical protein
MDHKFGIVSEFEPDDLQKVPDRVRIRARLGSSARNRLANSSVAIELAELLNAVRLVTCRPTGACNITHIMPPGRIWKGLRGGCQGWYPRVE